MDALDTPTPTALAASLAAGRTLPATWYSDPAVLALERVSCRGHVDLGDFRDVPGKTLGRRQRGARACGHSAGRSRS